jgi:hypothetical protein
MAIFRQRHDTKQASSIVKGPDVAENICASGAGRKIFLDPPFIEMSNHVELALSF